MHVTFFSCCIYLYFYLNAVLEFCKGVDRTNSHEGVSELHSSPICTVFCHLTIVRHYVELANMKLPLLSVYT